MKRRTFLLTVTGCCPFFLFSKNGVLAQPTDPTTPLPLLPADLEKIGLDAFADNELDLPYYVAHFHRLANSVVMEGENKGFISLPVWRNEKDNKPYNARIMENILSLAFFYVTDRPWNPYLGDEHLRLRLEAALEFWCRSNNDGRFSEYSEGGYNLAASAFATKFMGETISLLQAGKPKINADLFEKVRQIDRKTLMAVLKREDMIRSGKTFSNQYTNIFAGGLAYLDVFPDAELRTLLEKQIRTFGSTLQSPAGYFYEKGGPDWSYNLGTHHSNLRMCRFYTKNTDLAEFFLDEERQYVDWIAHNAIKEPSKNLFYLNKQVETRTSKDAWIGYTTRDEMNASLFILEATPLAAAFLPSREEILHIHKTQRENLRKNWPATDSLVLGQFAAFTPYRFLHRRHGALFPSQSEKEKSQRELPYLKSDRFTQQRLDAPEGACFTFVRRPAYYLIFNSGKQSSSQQRFGLGVLWTPEYGTFLQSQRDTGEIWGTQSANEKDVVEAGNFYPEFFCDGKEIVPDVGISDQKADVLRLSYGKAGGIKKEITLEDSSIRVSVTCPGKFVEQIPLLVFSDDNIRVEDNTLILSSGGGRFLQIRFNGAVTVKPAKIGANASEKQLCTVKIEANDSLEYVFVF